MKNPLVSILIPNYNHSCYLNQCIESAMNQTYQNIEIVVLDNDSSDESVKVASKYILDRRVRINKNPINIMNSNYRVLTECLSLGKYFILLCADDYIDADFIRRAVSIMEEYPNVGYVQGEKDFVDSKGKIIDWDPFYSCSFVAGGYEAMPIYMVTTVAHPSQGVIRKSAFVQIDGYDKEIDHMNADRTLWFYLSYENDMAYIRDKMAYIRIGNETETYVTQHNFQHPILCCLTIKDFVKYAKEKEIPEVFIREEEAYCKLAMECLDYSIGMLKENDYDMAKKYLQYAYVVYRSISLTEKYKKIEDALNNHKFDDAEFDKYSTSIVGRKHGYEPPRGFIEIDV